ncbi:hypothetical protein [Sorangium sp. So ce513]|uniref:hypothetical protein n=1 Tax=Sorangium sp. So ce513 TaxID=3133315 RepID=UPI003F5E6EA6
MKESFPKGEYVDVPGLSEVATLGEGATQGFSLNPGRHGGVADPAAEDFDFESGLRSWTRSSSS